MLKSTPLSRSTYEDTNKSWSKNRNWQYSDVSGNCLLGWLDRKLPQSVMLIDIDYEWLYVYIYIFTPFMQIDIEWTYIIYTYVYIHIYIYIYVLYTRVCMYICDWNPALKYLIYSITWEYATVKQLLVCNRMWSQGRDGCHSMPIFHMTFPTWLRGLWCGSRKYRRLPTPLCRRRHLQTPLWQLSSNSKSANTFKAYLWYFVMIG